MDSGLGAARGSFALIDGRVGMDCSADSNEKPNSPIRGIGGIIGPLIGLDATAASGFVAWVISVWVGTAVTTETSGVLLRVAIPTIAAVPNEMAPILPNSLR
jgi:hypothetical protein